MRVVLRDEGISPAEAGRLAEAAAGRAAEEDCLIAESESTEDVAAAPPAPETIH